MLDVGFEPTHSKVIGLKPIALDRSANPTNTNNPPRFPIFLITVRQEGYWIIM